MTVEKLKFKKTLQISYNDQAYVYSFEKIT